jgi:hypothetical protein
LIPDLGGFNPNAAHFIQVEQTSEVYGTLRLIPDLGGFNPNAARFIQVEQTSRVYQSRIENSCPFTVKFSI